MREIPTHKKYGVQGFTLIEMMIALTILAFISVGVYETTSRTFEMRAKLESEGDFYNSVRGALDIVRRDIIMMYTPQLAALPGSVAQRQVLNAGDTFDPGRATAFWGQLVNRFNIRMSRFQGDESKISFISNDHIRLYRESQESEFAKIVIALEEDKSPHDTEKAVGKALVRHEDPRAFIDDGRDSDTEIKYTLLTRVKDLKFRYLDGEKDQWAPRWDSDHPDTKDKFPALIELSIEVIPPPPQPPTATLSVKQVYKPELAL